MRLKRLTAGIVSASIMCSTLGYANTNSLYGQLSLESNGNWIVNKIGDSSLRKPNFDFNTKQPNGYDTLERGCYSTLWGKSNPCNESIEGFRNSSVKAFPTLFLNTVGQAFLLLPFLTSGFWTVKKSYFEEDKFSAAVNSAMSKIDVASINNKYNATLNKLDNLASNHKALVTSVEDRFTAMFNKYKSLQDDNLNSTKIRTAVIDNTGLWKYDVPTLNISTIELTKVSHDSDYSYKLEDTSPSDFSNQLDSLLAEYESKLNKDTDYLKLIEEDYGKELSKKASEMYVNHSDVYNVNGFNIKLNVPTLTIATSNKTINAEYTILNKNWDDVFPSYNNSDEVIKLDMTDGIIRIYNKTKKYVSINSIAVYYNNEVYNTAYEKAKDLPPDTIQEYPFKSFVNNAINIQASYSNVDKKSAQATDFKFGLAVKYRMIDQNVDRSLYKINKYNLFSVLKAQN